MSEFLQDLLKKVKQSADALEAPPAEPQRVRDIPRDVRSKRQKEPKPGFTTKPDSDSTADTEPDLTSKPGLADEPGCGTTPGLLPKPGFTTKPDSDSTADTEPDLTSKPGLADELGLAAAPDSLPKPGFTTKPDSGSSADTEPDLPTTPGLADEPFPFQLLRTFTHSKSAISNLIPHMKDSELRLYHYLADLTYGNSGSSTDHVIAYSQKEAMKATSIRSTATVVKSMNSLCKKRLVKWVRKSRKRGEVSQVKVFLPGHFQESRIHSDASSAE